MVAKILFFLFLIEAMFLYALAPDCYDESYNLLCLIQFVISICMFFLLIKKKNYLDFDTLFFITYFFVMFYYPCFLYLIDPTRYFVFQYEFNANVITRCTALSLLGFQSYLFGSVCSNRVLTCKSDDKVIKGVDVLVYIISIAFIVFLLFGGFRSLFSVYSSVEVENSSLGKYIFMFIPPLLFSAVIIEFYNIKIKSPNAFKGYRKSLLFFLLAFILVFLSSGNRSLPLQVFLLFMWAYSDLYKRISFFKLVPLVLLGMLILSIVGFVRVGENVQMNGFADIVMDLIINNRNSFVVVDYVDNNGITMGKSMLAPILSIIPFSQNIVNSLLGLDPTDTSSSIFISKLSLGTDNVTLGFGTNVVADIYLSFGAPGVVVLMFLLGYYIKFLRLNADKSVYYFASYAVLMSYAVILVRVEYFFFWRWLIWTLMIINILKLHPISIKKNI